MKGLAQIFSSNHAHEISYIDISHASKMLGKTQKNQIDEYINLARIYNIIILKNYIWLLIIDD